MSQVYDLGAYRAIAKGVQEFFLQTQVNAHADIYCQHDTSSRIDISCKQYDTRGVDDTFSPTAEEYAMPPKGWRSGRPEGIVKAVRLSEDIIERIARYVECLQAQLPDDRINEGVALRRLIRIGLDTVEGQASQPQPTPPTQPALPIALEGVPASERTQPPIPAPTAEPMPETTQTSYVPPGMQLCPNTRLKHPPYASSEKECPMCANNRRQREHYARNRAKQ